jgi:serine/threonine protein kinase
MLGKLLHGRYQVFRTLGSGGFGETYIAKDLHRPGYPKCVVKHFKPTTDNPKFLSTAKRLFNSEAEILERLGKHDQIPQLLAYFEEDENLFLVQELIEGHPLEAELAANPRWTEAQAIHLLLELLPILDFIHQQRVIHRDINPSNIIRRHDRKLVLIDFGAVKQIQTQFQNPNAPIAQTVVVGTLGFISREQSMGQPNSTSDLYAVGMLVIQALTGLHPIQLDSDPQTGEVLWQKQVNVSPAFAGILSGMVAANFQQRYPSAIAILNALQSLTDLPTLPERTTIPPSSVQDTLPRPTNGSDRVLEQTSLPRPTNGSDRVLEQTSLPCDEQFVRQCEQDLVEFVGPIATFIVQRAIRSYPQISRIEFVRIVSAELSDNPQSALKFQQRVLSGILQ